LDGIIECRKLNHQSKRIVMNKTVTINLGGIVFHIDEDAYQKLSRYFDAIKRSLTNSSGQDEIIKDIEMRISELLGEKLLSDKHVIGLKEIDEVIAVMGQPEDYIIEEEPKSEPAYQAHKKSKKLYRDKDKGMIGGVAAGLSHYFGIDVVWIRVLLLLFFFGFGTGVLAYVILWIATPEAITTSEKLEMTGEPVTISSIEKKVREEFDSVSEKFKNVDYDKYGNQIKTGADKFAGSLGEIITNIFKVFAKFLGVILIISGVTVLFFLFVGIFTLGSVAFIKFPWTEFVNAGNFTDYPIWVFGLLMFLAVGIPFFFLTLLGFRLLSPTIKSIGSIAKYTLLALWILAIAALISIGIQQASEVAYEGKTVQKENLNIQPTDTLQIKFRYNEYYTKDIDDNDNFRFVQDASNNQLIYSNNIRFEILKTDEKLPFIQIERLARGKSFQEAKKRAEKIQYGFKLEGNQLLLDNYLLTSVTDKFRDQEVAIYLYLPEGVLFKVDQSAQHYDESDNDFFNLHYSSDSYLYKVNSTQVKCLNCPENENEYNDVETGITEDSTGNDTVVTTTVKVNGEIVRIKQSAKGGLTIDNKGIIIKK
jgi:phage shock protein PspC (stress-responsive transcriptional regulator)